MNILYKKYLLPYCLILISYAHTEIFNGYTLFSPLIANQNGAITYLINNEYDILHTWSHEQGAASMPYLLPDSSIVYPYRVPNPTMVAGGVGGGVQSQSWDGIILWEYEFSNNTYQHHHDVEPLPNGNVLLIVWENKSAEEAYALGREIISNPLNQMWSTAILELNPETGNIDWEWHLWDHLVQDIDPSLPNYGNISEHPELFNINCGDVGQDAGGPQGANADWMHINSVHYNPSLDQIILSSRTQNEIYIIDHSTTSEEATSHAGGNSGKGGDILYRWGNPENYDRGDINNKVLGWQHSVNWIANGYPNAGNIIIFNNNHFEGVENHTAVIEIQPPLDENGEYILNENMAYGPESLEWMYVGDIQTPLQGGAFRLPNGNTIITQTHTAKIVEVDLDGNEVWSFQFTSDLGSAWIARCQKYSQDYLMDSIIGDMNADGIQNILDIVILVNLVLAEDNSNPSGDVNGDETQNILDIVILINLILEED